MQVIEVIIVQFVSSICLLFLSWVKMLSSAHSQTHICRCVIVTLPVWRNIKVESRSRLGPVACLFQSDVSVPLEPDSQCLETRNEIFEAVNHYLQQPVLQRIRKYLTAVCFLEYSLPQLLEQVCVLHFFVFHRLQMARFCQSPKRPLCRVATTTEALTYVGSVCCTIWKLMSQVVSAEKMR